MVTSLEIDELLELVEKENYTQEEIKDSSVSINDPILTFIQAFGLKPGDHPVPQKAIFSLYTHWAKYPLKRRTFYNRFSNYFVTQPLYSRNYYLLDKDSLAISKRTIELQIKDKHPRTKNKNYKNHFESFLKAHKLERGTFWVPFQTLYHVYDKWTYKNKNLKPLGRDSFYDYCCMYFNYKENRNLRAWFRVSSTFKEILPYGVHRDLERQYKNGKKASERRKEARKQEIKSRLSRSRSSIKFKDKI